MPRLDLSDLAVVAVENMIENALFVFGIEASVYEYVVTDSIYNEIYPELSVEEAKPKFRANIKVLFGESLSGSNITKHISLMGLIDEERTIITDYNLKQDQRVEIKFEDGKDLTVRVLNSEAIHSQSTLPYRYYVQAV